MDSSISKGEVMWVRERREKAYRDSSISLWFELSHAAWLTIPRIVMESMPHEWQGSMKKLLEEMDDTFDWRPENGRYCVSLRKDNGEFTQLPEDLCNYRHGNIEHRRSK